MMSTNTAADELWAWVFPPLEQLRDRCTAEPDAPLEQHFAAFLEELGVREVVDQPLLWSFWERLEALPDDAERTRFLAGDAAATLVYDLVQEHAGQQEQAGVPEQALDTYDEAGWQAFLAEHGSRWDGTGPSWTQFREWFLYEAGQQGFGTPTTMLATYLDSLDVAERIDALAQYGVTVPAQWGGADVDPASLAIADELLQENPEFADIPEERRRELMAEVLASMSPQNEMKR
jgi:hypothetical protein